MLSICRTYGDLVSNVCRVCVDRQIDVKPMSNRVLWLTLSVFDSVCDAATPSGLSWAAAIWPFMGAARQLEDYTEQTMTYDIRPRLPQYRGTHSANTFWRRTRRSRLESGRKLAMADLARGVLGSWRYCCHICAPSACPERVPRVSARRACPECVPGDACAQCACPECVSRELARTASSAQGVRATTACPTFWPVL